MSSTLNEAVMEILTESKAFILDLDVMPNELKTVEKMAKKHRLKYQVLDMENDDNGYPEIRVSSLKKKDIISFLDDFDPDQADDYADMIEWDYE